MEDFMKKILLITTLIFANNLFAFVDKHDFAAETWSNGKSCLVCHSLVNDLPKLSPPGSRVVDLTKLTAEEKAGYDVNTSNVMCLVCHQDKHSVIAPRTNSSSGNALPMPQNPGSVTSGSEGSTNIRVINRGANSYDCLQCHDLHNKDSLKMLKADYYQN
jgi:hypothetical protein